MRKIYTYSYIISLVFLILCSGFGGNASQNNDSIDTIFGNNSVNTVLESTNESTEQSDDAVLNSFFAPIEIPKFTLQDAIKKEECTFVGNYASASLVFKERGERVEIDGYGFWGTELILSGEVVNDYVVVNAYFGVKEDDNGEVFFKAPVDNLGLFHSGEMTWIEEGIWKKIEKATPTIRYQAPDGTELEMKYYSPEVQPRNAKASGNIQFKKCSRDFLKRFTVSEEWLSASDYIKEDYWEFRLDKNNELNVMINLFEEGEINLKDGQWTPDEINFPAIPKKALPEVTFTRQK